MSNSDSFSCNHKAQLRLKIVQGFFRVPTQLRARSSVCSDVISCIPCRDFRHGFVQAICRRPTSFRAELFPASDSISCKPHSDFRFTFVQASSPAPRTQCGLLAALCHFEHKTTRICNILCLSGTERRQGLWRASQRQRAVPRTHLRKKTHMRLVRSLPIPAPCH